MDGGTVASFSYKTTSIHPQICGMLSFLYLLPWVGAFFDRMGLLLLSIWFIGIGSFGPSCSKVPLPPTRFKNVTALCIEAFRGVAPFESSVVNLRLRLITLEGDVDGSSGGGTPLVNRRQRTVTLSRAGC
jgi:hypothetical protein